MSERMPKYLELYKKLKDAILSGEYAAGTFLPTENELMDLYDVSKTTVRHAVKLLAEEKLISVQQGSGTSVLAAKQETVKSPKFHGDGLEVSLSVEYSGNVDAAVVNTNAAVDQIPAPEECAGALGVAPGTPVWRIQRLQKADGILFGYMVNYLKKDLVPGLDSKTSLEKNLYGMLLREYNIEVTGSDEAVCAAAAGFKESQYLHVEIGAPLLVLKRVARDAAGNAIEYCETTVIPDIFQMVIHTTYRSAFED